MVLIQNIVMTKCRLCQDKPGEYDISNDKNLIKEIYECIKIRVNDKAMTLLPQSVCEECKKTIKNFIVYKQHVQKVDQSLRKIILEPDSKCSKLKSLSEDNKFKCSEYSARSNVNNMFNNHIKSEPLQKNNFHHETKCVKCVSEEKVNCLMYKDHFNNVNVAESHGCEKDSQFNSCQNAQDKEILALAKNENESEFQLKTESLIIVDREIQKDEEQINCDICERKFETTEELKNHKESHKTKYVCSWKNCKKVLNSSYTLKTHELKHAGKRSFLCVTCGKGFITKNSLTCHEKIHLDVKGYICKLCNIGFSVRSNLRAHEKKHHEGIRFYCSQCTKAFISKCSLERHERIHTGIKEFQCESCPSAFYTNKELVKHQRYHQGLRLHKCNECYKTFFERHHLVIHLRSHTGERPYMCKVANCGKSFMESQKLKRHHKAKHAQE